VRAPTGRLLPSVIGSAPDPARALAYLAAVRTLPSLLLLLALTWPAVAAAQVDPSDDDAEGADPEATDPADAPDLTGDVIPAGPVDPLDRPPRIPDFSIIYEGGTGGVSGASSELWADGLVAAGLAGDEGHAWRRLAGGWGAFLDDGRWLLQATGGVARFHDVVAPSVAAGGEPVRVEGLVTADYAVFVWPPQPELLPLLEAALATDPVRPPPARAPFDAVPCPVAEGEPTLLVRHPSDRRPLEAPLEPVAWETRIRSVFEAPGPDGGPPIRIHVVSRLEGEGGRRAALAARWRTAPSVYVSGGEAVEGRSYLADQPLSLQRPLTWGAWKELGLTALAPGEAELLAGLDGLRAEAEAIGTALVSVNLLRADGELAFDPWTVHEVAGRRVALVGWTDPDVPALLPPDLRGQVKLRSMSAVQEALAALADGDDRPDLVVLFGVGAREVAGQVPAVDIVLGDFTTTLRMARWEEVDEASLRARSEEHPRARAPALVTRLGGHMLGRIDVDFDEESGSLTGLRHLRARIAEDHPPDPDRIREVQEIRQGVYAGMEDVLVPGLSGLPDTSRRGLAPLPAELDAGAFAQLAANLLMDRTGADLALLRPLPQPVTVPGETLSLYVDASLSVADEVVVIEVTGAQLKRLLRLVEPRIPKPGQPGHNAAEDAASWAWTAGVLPAGKKVKVRGRLVQDDEPVLLATTDFFAADPAFAAVVAKARAWRSFRGKGWTRIPTALGGGKTWRLHDLVKDGLSGLRDEHPDFGEAYARRLTPLMADNAGRRTGRLTLELDGLSALVTGSVGVGERAGYEESRESRVNQENSLNVGLRGRIALVWQDRVGSLTGYGLGAFGRSHLPEVDDPVELEDNLELGAVGKLRLASVPAPKAAIPLSTFLQSAFDTEFSAQEDDAGDKLPLQRILRTTGGVELGKYVEARSARAGFFVEYDFSADTGPVAPGINVVLLAQRTLAPVRWSLLSDFKGYFPTPDDSAEDLAFTLQLRAEVGVQPLKRLIPGLAVGGFADALVFQGKLDSNDQVGMHVLLGASLTYDADIRPPLRLR